MATFQHHENPHIRSRTLSIQAVLILIVFLAIASVLISRDHTYAGFGLLLFAVLFFIVDFARSIRIAWANGKWDIVIDEKRFTWIAPNPSLGPKINVPIRFIKSFEISTYLESEIESGKRYYLVMADGTREQLWGLDSAPMDKVTECLEANGVPIQEVNV
ncbi:MAG: hypothetical protein V4563_05190 [Pseudomonadota bacterium]